MKVGRVLNTLDLEINAYVAARFLFVTQFFYVFTVWSVKVSVLFFYKKVFITSGFRHWANGTVLVLLAWIIAFIS
jgi:hypothetical protein